MSRSLSFLLSQESLFKISTLADTMLISKKMKYWVIDCAINDTFKNWNVSLQLIQGNQTDHAYRNESQSQMTQSSPWVPQ